MSVNATTPVCINLCLRDVFAGFVQRDSAPLRRVTVATTAGENRLRFHNENNIWDKVRLHMMSQVEPAASSATDRVLTPSEYGPFRRRPACTFRSLDRRRSGLWGSPRVYQSEEAVFGAVSEMVSLALSV